MFNDHLFKLEVLLAIVSIAGIRLNISKSPNISTLQNK
jgi:hypothetical protein